MLYKALSLLIAITFDPSKYKFKIGDEQEEKYSLLCEEYFEKLKTNIRYDLDIHVFNDLKEMIVNCPEKMYELLEFWCNENEILSLDLEKNIIKANDNKGLRVQTQLMLSKISFYLRF